MSVIYVPRWRHRRQRSYEVKLGLLFLNYGGRDGRGIGTISKLRTCSHSFITHSRKPRYVQASPWKLLWKPLHVPLAQPFDILDHQLKSAEIQGSYCVKRDIEEDESPLEEGIGGVG